VKEASQEARAFSAVYSRLLCGPDTVPDPGQKVSQQLDRLKKMTTADAELTAPVLPTAED
jgi:hypothetical protein